MDSFLQAELHGFEAVEFSDPFFPVSSAGGFPFCNSQLTVSQHVPAVKDWLESSGTVSCAGKRSLLQGTHGLSGGRMPAGFHTPLTPLFSTAVYFPPPS